MTDRLLLANTLFGLGVLLAWILAAMSLAFNDHPLLAWLIFFGPIFGGAIYFWMTS